MPNEILAQVFGYFEMARSIPNIRLACRRFEAVASGFLLLDHIRVSVMDPQNVAAFEGLSRNPAIARGVKEVEIDVRFYRYFPAEGIQAFTAFMAEAMMDGQCHFCMHTFGDDMDDWPIEEDYENATGLAEMLLSGFFKDSSVASLALEAAFSRYRRSYAAQQCLRNDNVAGRLAEAIARMPRARMLHFMDRHPFFAVQDTFSFDEDGLVWPDDEDLARLITLPQQWVTESWRDDSPPTEVLFEVLAAIHQAGASLDEVQIQVASLPEEIHTGQANLDHWRSAIENLTSMTVWATVNANVHSSDPISSLGGVVRHKLMRRDSFVEVAIRSSRLEQLFVWPCRVRPGIFLSLLPQQLRNLRFIGLKFGSISFEDLAAIIRSTGTRKLEVSLCHVTLTTGTWADVLDVIREIQPSTWTNECGTDWYLTDLTGGGLKRPMDFFEPGHGGSKGKMSPAGRYMFGLDAKNPLRH